MIATKQDVHLHDFKKPQETKVMLHRYRNREDISIVGYDWLIQYVCDCGKVETRDLKRHKV